MKILYSLIILCAVFVNSSILAGEVRSGADDQTGITVTIYNNNLAMIRDERRITLPIANTHLAFEDISAKIKPETAQLSSRQSQQPLSLIEQNFEFDLLSPEALLKAYEGQSVKFATVNPATGESILRDALVLSTQGGTVLQFGDQIETNPKGEYIFPTVPDNFRARPTLLITLDNTVEGPQDLELNYLSHGLGWEANYVASLSDDETSLNLNSWVTLTNQSGTAFQNAQLQLVAGDVNTVLEPKIYQKQSMRIAEATAMDSGFSQAEAFDYHLYRLNRPTNLSNNQTKQVALFAANSVPVSKSYVLTMQPHLYMSQAYQKQEDLKVATQLRFVNDHNSDLGQPLPKGTIRIYQTTKDGNALFIGEDRIDHTPKNKTVTLKPGNAFDITATREQLEFEMLPVSKPYRTMTNSTVRTTLYNAKKNPVKVRLEEVIPGEWQITAGQKMDERQGGKAIWFVEVPAEGETSIQYSVNLKF